MLSTEIIVAIIAALSGGTGLKLVEGWLGRNKVKEDQNKALRDELRDQAIQLKAQIKTLQEEIKATESELDSWKEKYWKIYMDYNMFQISVRAILAGNGIDPNILSTIIPKTDIDAS